MNRLCILSAVLAQQIVIYCTVRDCWVSRPTMHEMSQEVFQWVLNCLEVHWLTHPNSTYNGLIRCWWSVLSSVCEQPWKTLPLWSSVVRGVFLLFLHHKKTVMCHMLPRGWVPLAFSLYECEWLQYFSVYKSSPGKAYSSSNCSLISSFQKDIWDNSLLVQT